MFFTNWINWILSFFVIQNNSQDDKISSNTVHRNGNEVIKKQNSQSLYCQEKNTKIEVNKSNTELMQTNCQGISAKPESTEEMDKEIKKNMENMKFKNVLEKIRKYHILDDGDFQYIKLLSNDQMMKLIRNLQ
jgi:hypothetical protein